MLEQDLRLQIAEVDAKVARSGGDEAPFKADRDYVRVAARVAPRVIDLLQRRDRPLLGAYKGSLLVRPSAEPGQPPEVGDKAQLLLRFAGPTPGSRDRIAKIYGYQRWGEAQAMREASNRDKRTGQKSVPEVFEATDFPVTVIVMEALDGPPFSEDMGPEALSDLTRALGKSVAQIHLLEPPANAGSLEDDVALNLGAVMRAAKNHGYDVPENYAELARVATNLGTPTVLHTDLFFGNIGTEYAGGPALVFDTVARIGPREMDAVRWATRVSTDPATYERDVQARLAEWTESSGETLDPKTTAALLWMETLAKAGVIEIIKDERGLPWSDRDANTEAYLSMADRFLQRSGLEQMARAANGREGGAAPEAPGISAAQ